MRVSIAMATYNGARFIGAQLASFAAQTVVPDELVITDDGSSDDTLAIVEAFAATAPFAVEVHRNPARLGYARNFEKAIGLCGGEIIFLSDQDDVWLEDKIAVVLDCFDANPETMVVINDAMITDGDLIWFGRTQYGIIERSHIPRSGFVQGCCSAHRAAWRKIALPLPDGVQLEGHDEWLNGLAYELGVVTLCRQPLQYYRRHAENASGSVLSDPHGGAMLRALVADGLKDSRPRWIRRAEVLDAMLARIELLGSDRFGAAARNLRRKRDQQRQRIAFCSVPRHRRASAVLRFWRASGYAGSSGWKGAIKDLVRP